MGIAGPALCLITPSHDGADPINPGQGIRLSATVTSLGSPFTPQNMALATKDPTGTIVAYTPTLDSTGQYHQDITLSGGAATGIWLVKWQATGSGGGAGYANNYAIGLDSFEVGALPF